MAITLRADNRSLLKDAKYSYLLDNTSSGVSSITVANTDSFAHNDFVIIGNIGSENTELVQVDTVTEATGVLTLVSNTRFSHSESSRVSVVGYNQIRFYWTSLLTVPNPSASPITVNSVVQNNNITTTGVQVTTSPNTAIYTKTTDPTKVENVDVTPPIIFNSDTPLALPSDIQVDSFYSTYSDSAHSTGYGWFAFYNSTTLSYSAISNAIPYSGFNSNTVKEVFSDFDSCLNQKELKLISMEDRYSWLNEAYNIMTNELNTGNWEYNSSGPLNLTIKSGVAEYLLPDDFSNMLYINETSSGDKINHYSSTFQIPRSTSFREYEIRGRYLVFRPVPTTDSTVTLEYLKISSRLTDLQSVINLPDNASYSLKDFMLFRAYRKLGNLTESTNSLTLFNKNIERMKIYSIKRDNGLDSWSIDNAQNV